MRPEAQSAYLESMASALTTLLESQFISFIMDTDIAGSLQEVIDVPRTRVFGLPAGVGAAQAAALVNPLMGGWMGLKHRAGLAFANRPRDWTCLVLGATGVSGAMAARAARCLGARVIGPGRQRDKLSQLRLRGVIDEAIVLDGTSSVFSASVSAAVVLDYLNGPYPRMFLEERANATEELPSLTYISLGSVAGSEMHLPASLIRAQDVRICGSGLGSWRIGDLLPEIPGMFQVLQEVAQQEVKPVDTVVYPVERIENAWMHKLGSNRRLVIEFGEAPHLS